MDEPVLGRDYINFNFNDDDYFDQHLYEPDDLAFYFDNIHLFID